jgi:hypothetical protein
MTSDLFGPRIVSHGEIAIGVMIIRINHSGGRVAAPEGRSAPLPGEHVEFGDGLTHYLHAVPPQTGPPERHLHASMMAGRRPVGSSFSGAATVIDTLRYAM